MIFVLNSHISCHPMSCHHFATDPVVSNTQGNLITVSEAATEIDVTSILRFTCAERRTTEKLHLKVAKISPNVFR